MNEQIGRTMDWEISEVVNDLFEAMGEWSWTHT